MSDWRTRYQRLLFWLVLALTAVAIIGQIANEYLKQVYG